MQSGLAQMQSVQDEFCVELAKFSVKRFSFKDAFKVSHRPAATYDISLTPRVGKVEAKPSWSDKEFFAVKTIDQLVAEQGINPIADISIFAGAIPDEDVDEFVADIYRNRT